MWVNPAKFAANPETCLVSQAKKREENKSKRPQRGVINAQHPRSRRRPGDKVRSKEEHRNERGRMRIHQSEERTSPHALSSPTSGPS